MTPQARKICMLGDFGVGKTSLVARFVRNTFSDSYLTTVGVKVDSKEVALANGQTQKLVVWDIAGKSALDALNLSYLRGASGCRWVTAVAARRERMLMADGASCAPRADADG